MEECMRKTERDEDDNVVELVSQGNVRSRDIEDVSSSSKRMKVELEINEFCTTSPGSPEEFVSPEVSETYEQAESSACSEDDFSKDSSKSVDLKVDLAESEISVCSNGGLREVVVNGERTTLSSPMEETRASSLSQKKLSPAISNHTIPTTPNYMPSAEEIEDFFSAAEKYEQKRFTDKYNYDIVNDIPLEGGRYEWFKL